MIGRKMSNWLLSANGMSRVIRRLLAIDMFPELPSSIVEPRYISDYVLRVLQVVWAFLLRRNPQVPAWRQRTIARWQTIGDGPGPNERSERAKPLLVGITAVWDEEDIIYANVRNLFDQGADLVYVIDDGSGDATVEEAKSAGALVVLEKNDGVYSEKARYSKIQKMIREKTAEFGGDVWWIVVDADEFPRGPNSQTIKEFVLSLPLWVDVVGSRVLDHSPSREEAYVRRDHPLRAIPMAQWYRWPWCRNGHWKHQLLRVRAPGELIPMPGHHTVKAIDNRRVREYDTSLIMHHFPIRNRFRTEAKMHRAAAGGGRYERSPDTFTRWRIAQRLSMLDYIYSGRLAQVPNSFPGESRLGITLRDWRELVNEEDSHYEGGCDEALA